MKSYTPLEREILQHISAHISRNEEVSLTQLSDECHVAKSSIIKVLQKLGYQGMKELRRNLRMDAQTSANVLLPRSVTHADLDQASSALAQCFRTHADSRNFIFSGDRRCASLLAAYMSRKLAMFDILSPDSYDYAMTAKGTRSFGFAIFCFHREAGEGGHLGQQSGYGQGMLAEAKHVGYEIVVISDDADLCRDAGADLAILIAKNSEAAIDLYMTRVLMLFELALSKLSRM